MVNAEEGRLVSAAAGLGGGGTAAAGSAQEIEGRLVVASAAAMAAASAGEYRDIRTLRKKKLNSSIAAETSAAGKIRSDQLEAGGPRLRGVGTVAMIAAGVNEALRNAGMRPSCGTGKV